MTLLLLLRSPVVTVPAVTYRASSFAAINSGATTGTFVIPAGAVVGDEVFLMMGDGAGQLTGVGFSGGAGGAWTHGAGWPAGAASASANVGGDFWYKPVESGDPGATITVTWTETGQKAVFMCLVLDQVDISNPILVDGPGLYDNTADLTWSTPTINLSVDAYVVAWVVNRDSSVTTTFTCDQGTMTERGEISATGTSQVAGALYDSNGLLTANAALTLTGTQSQSLQDVTGIFAVRLEGGAVSFAAWGVPL